MLPDHLLMGLTPSQDPMSMMWLVLHPLLLLPSWMGSVVNWWLLVIPPLLYHLKIHLYPPLRPPNSTLFKLLHLLNQEEKIRTKENPKKLLLRKVVRKPNTLLLRVLRISINLSTHAWCINKIILPNILLASPRSIRILSKVVPLLHLRYWPILFPFITNKWLQKIMEAIQVTHYKGVIHTMPTLWCWIVWLVYPHEIRVMKFHRYQKINHQPPNPMALLVLRNWIWNLLHALPTRYLVIMSIIQMLGPPNIIASLKTWPRHLVSCPLLKCYKFVLELGGLIPHNKIL